MAKSNQVVIASKKGNPKKVSSVEVVHKMKTGGRGAESGAAAAAAACARIKRARRSKINKPKEGKEGVCTNSFCSRTWDKTWRKGPLGPKTLCNACGLQYIKLVRSRGSGITKNFASLDLKK